MGNGHDMGAESRRDSMTGKGKKEDYREHDEVRKKK